MPYLIQNLTRDSFWHRYISRERLIEVLSKLPDGCVISVTPVGELGVFSGVEDGEYGDQLGYIDVAEGKFNPFEEDQEEPENALE